MNEVVELHDSTLAAVRRVGAGVTVLLSPAYLHRSEGVLWEDFTSGWLQTVCLAFAEGAVDLSANPPCRIADGCLCVGDARHDNILPLRGSFEAACELRLELAGDVAPIVVRGSSLVITPLGEPTYVEKVHPRA